jgi:hypothetical protein
MYNFSLSIGVEVGRRKMVRGTAGRLQKFELWRLLDLCSSALYIQNATATCTVGYKGAITYSLTELNSVLQLVRIVRAGLGFASAGICRFTTMQSFHRLIDQDRYMTSIIRVIRVDWLHDLSTSSLDVVQNPPIHASWRGHHVGINLRANHYKGALRVWDESVSRARTVVSHAYYWCTSATTAGQPLTKWNSMM